MPLLNDPWLPSPGESGAIPANRLAAPVRVYRSDGQTLSPLANLECLSIAYREGTDPGHAHFRYNLASGLDGSPNSIETALGTGFTGPGVVEPGDRLVVLAGRPDGGSEPLFDGEAVSFAMSLSPDAEEVHIDALGIAWHCWDRPIGGALIRAADGPTVAADVATDVVAHFNPGGKPNCSPEKAEMAGTKSSGRDRQYPTFLDPLVIRSPDKRSQWTLPKACRYLLYRCNDTEEFVKNPDGGVLDQLLVAADLSGESAGQPIAVPDLPVTGKDWPGTIGRLIGDVGFGMKFQVSLDDQSGLPRTDLVLFAQQGGVVKDLYLAARGTPFDPSLYNLAASSLHRDVAGVVNQWTVRGALTRWEASFVLACGFPCQAADAASATTLAAFEKNHPSFVADSTRRNAYRLYVFDETGEGHYAAGSATRSNKVPSLDDLFGADTYAHRRRRPLGELVSVDASKKPYRARLAISTDYEGFKPGLWDGSGTWQTLTTTTWRLLSDRLGIMVSDTNPNSWDIGESKVDEAPYPAGVVKGIEDQALASAKHFSLRLTCVVESDTALTISAVPGPESPISRPIERYVDASDRLGKTFVHDPSEFNQAGADKLVRDDTTRAKAEAASLRTAHEAGVLEGPCEIPRLTTYYRIGDRIGSINGRGLGLRTDSGQGDGSPIYPVVVGIRWDFEGGQKTTLELSDAGSRRRQRPRKRRVLRDSNGKPRWNRRGG